MGSIANHKAKKKRDDMELATVEQRDYIKILCDNLGYDPDDYLSTGLTKWSASQIISDLKDEWEG
jgi:hypothetical protein